MIKKLMGKCITCTLIMCMLTGFCGCGNRNMQNTANIESAESDNTLESAMTNQLAVAEQIKNELEEVKLSVLREAGMPQGFVNQEVCELSEDLFNKFVEQNTQMTGFGFNTVPIYTYKEIFNEYGETKTVILSDEMIYAVYKSPYGGEFYAYFRSGGDDWDLSHYVHKQNSLSYADFGELKGKTAEYVSSIDNSMQYKISMIPDNAREWISCHLLEDGLLVLWYNHQKNDTVTTVQYTENFVYYYDSYSYPYDFNTEDTLKNAVTPTKYEDKQILTLSEEAFNTLMKEEVEMIHVVECMADRRTEYLHSLSYFSKKYGATKSVVVSDNTAYSIYKSPQGGYLYVYFYDVGGDYWCKSHIAYRENVLRYDDFKVLTGGLTPAELKALNSVKGEIPH